MSKQLETAKNSIKQLAEITRKESNNLYYEGSDYKYMYNIFIDELNELEKLIIEYKEKAILLRDHKCIFNEEDYCDICKKDGRA